MEDLQSGDESANKQAEKRLWDLRSKQYEKLKRTRGLLANFWKLQGSEIDGKVFEIIDLPVIALRRGETYGITKSGDAERTEVTEVTEDLVIEIWYATEYGSFSAAQATVARRVVLPDSHTVLLPMNGYTQRQAEIVASMADKLEQAASSGDIPTDYDAVSHRPWNTGGRGASPSPNFRQ